MPDNVLAQIMHTMNNLALLQQGLGYDDRCITTVQNVGFVDIRNCVHTDTSFVFRVLIVSAKLHPLSCLKSRSC